METFEMIADERRQLADLLESLSSGQLATRSLCGDWTVHEVAAHLITPLETSMPKMMLTMLVCRGNLDRANVRLTSQHARRSIAVIVEVLRRKANARFTPPGMGPEAPLTDLLVHGLDIRWPLDIARKIPDDRLRTALRFVAETPAKGFVAPGRLDGLRLEAADIDWAHGSGLVVRGTATGLLLAATGRSAAYEQLTGHGVATLQAR